MKGRPHNPFEGEPIPNERGIPRRPIRGAYSVLTTIPALIFAVAATFWILQLFSFASSPQLTNAVLKFFVMFPAFFVWFFVGCQIFADLERFLPWRACTLFAAVASLLLGWFLFIRVPHPRASTPVSLPAREATVEEWRQRHLEASYKWFGDVQASGLRGGAGSAPPWVAVREDADTVTLSNLSDLHLGCVSLSRVSASGERCELLADGAACGVLVPRGARSWQTRTAAACIGMPLEFRIGDVRHPEPSWWSDSALTVWRKNLDGVESSDEIYGVPPPDAAARGAVVTQLEADLGDFDRAIRWQADLADWIKAAQPAAPR